MINQEVGSGNSFCVLQRTHYGAADVMPLISFLYFLGVTPVV